MNHSPHPLSVLLIASSSLAGCQTIQDAAAPSFESVQISECDHIPDNRPNTIKRRDCISEVLISYRTEHEFPDMDIAQEVALNYKLATIELVTREARYQLLDRR